MCKPQFRDSSLSSKVPAIFHFIFSLASLFAYVFSGKSVLLNPLLYISGSSTLTVTMQ